MRAGVTVKVMVNIKVNNKVEIGDRVHFYARIVGWETYGFIARKNEENPMTSRTEVTWKEIVIHLVDQAVPSLASILLLDINLSYGVLAWIIFLVVSVNPSEGLF